jgi:hypothetical protein
MTFLHLDIRSRPRKPRGISSDLRALIDAALSEGRVTVIPAGVSGLPYARWDDQKKCLVDEDSRPLAEKAQDRRRAAREARQ